MTEQVVRGYLSINLMLEYNTTILEKDLGINRNFVLLVDMILLVWSAKVEYGKY